MISRMFVVGGSIMRDGERHDGDNYVNCASNEREGEKLPWLYACLIKRRKLFIVDTSKRLNWSTDTTKWYV